AFFWKLDGAGGQVWTESIGGSTGFDAGQSVAVDGSKNLYFAGTYQGTANFNPNPAGPAHNMTSVQTVGQFVLKLDPNGSYLFSTDMGAGSGTTVAGRGGVAIDAAGKVWVTGSFQGTASFGGRNLTSVGASDVFVAMLDPANGNVLDAVRGGGAGEDLPDGLSVVPGSTPAKAFLAGSYVGSA